MPQGINFNKGSKRRMERIRWKLNEVISAVVVSRVILVFCAIIAWWKLSHDSVEPKTPQVKWQR